MERKKSRSKKKKERGASCFNCHRALQAEERVLFVEEEIGRVFCSENCIGEFFKPEIDRLEHEYYGYLTPNDLPGELREQLAGLRWRTLKSPDEMWIEKTLTGDKRYQLIAEYEFKGKPIWSVCLCLFLRGEPSFLFIAFITENSAMVEQYRRGEPVNWKPAHEDRLSDHGTENDTTKATEAADTDGAVTAELLLGVPAEKGQEEADNVIRIDGLAGPWTAEETRRAKRSQDRRKDDVPPENFSQYEKLIEETLQSPHEVWSLKAPHGEKDRHQMYHFLKHFPQEEKGLWYIIVARETDEEDQIEILDAFPTIDSLLVEQYRTGLKEIDQEEVPPTSSRMVH